ncbi:MAG: formate dehydrogenase accessory sulfurtransferase FdhD [Pseudomonadota bacterium]
MSDQNPPPAIAAWPAYRLHNGQAPDQAQDERVAVELPFELRLNGRSHTVLMVSPLLLEELALGLCLSEGLVDGPEQVLGVTLGQAQLPGVGMATWADVALPPELARRAKVRRVAPAATSCGLCGLESLAQLGQRPPAPVGPGPRVELAALFALLAAMEQGQRVFGATGATHAAALGDDQGRLLCLGEDVGRHNALDKALGLAIKAGVDLGGCLTVLSGRLSYEMALKSARAGLSILASVSAPTSLGLGLTQRLDMTLVGFLRGQRATVYTHPRRVLVGGQPLAASGQAQARRP